MTRRPFGVEDRCTATTLARLNVEAAAIVRCQKSVHHDNAGHAREYLDPFHEWVTSDRETGRDPYGRGRDQTIRITWATTPAPGALL